MNKRKRKEDSKPAIMPPGMSEKALQIKVIRILREQGFRVLHAYDSFKSDSGFPDLHAVHVEEKKLIVIELKREGQSPRDDQVEVLAAYEAMGIPVFIWRPSDLERIPELLAQFAPPEWMKPGFKFGDG